MGEAQVSIRYQLIGFKQLRLNIFRSLLACLRLGVGLCLYENWLARCVVRASEVLPNQVFETLLRRGRANFFLPEFRDRALRFLMVPADLVTIFTSGGFGH